MKIEEYASGIGFELKDKVYIKEVNGYNLYLKDYDYVVMKIASIYIPVDKKIDKLTKSVIERECKNACFIQRINSLDILIVTLPEGNKTGDKFKNDVNEEINAVVKNLDELGYKKATLCPFCSKEVSYIEFGNDYIPVCEECKNKYINDLKKLAKEETGFTYKYAVSIALSMLLGIIGLLPALLLAIFNHDFFTPLAVICPIFASSGYYFSKAPAKLWLRITTGIIVFIIIASFAIWAIPFMATENSLSLSDYIFTGQFTGLRKIIFLGLFSLGGFGITKFINKFKKNPTNELKNFE